MLSTAPHSCHFINSFIKEDLATLDCHGNASAEPSPLSENTKRARQPLSPPLGRRKRGCFEVEDVPTSPPSHRDGATPQFVSLFTACIVDDEPSPTPLIAKPRAQRCPAPPMPPRRHQVVVQPKEKLANTRTHFRMMPTSEEAESSSEVIRITHLLDRPSEEGPTMLMPHPPSSGRRCVLFDISTL